MSLNGGQEGGRMERERMEQEVKTMKVGLVEVGRELIDWERSKRCAKRDMERAGARISLLRSQEVSLRWRLEEVSKALEEVPGPRGAARGVED